MNAEERARPRRRGAPWPRTTLPALAACLLWACAASAFDPAYPLTDPLSAAPEALEHGVTLPGDQAPAPCPAYKDFAAPLTLGEAVDLALCNNPQIRGSWAAVKIQASGLGEARAAYLPALNGSMGQTNDRIRYSDARYASSDIDRSTAQASLTWRLLDFGGRSANRQAAEHLLSGALASHNATLQKALAGVIQAYCDALTARSAFRAKTEGVDLAASTLRSAAAREGKGTHAKTDTLQATTALAKATLEKNRAGGEYEKALSVLGYLLGETGHPAIMLPEQPDEQTQTHESAALASWLEEAQKRHPALIAARDQLEAARQRVDVARSASLPSLGFTASHYRNTRPGEAVTSAESQETTVGLALSIPLFDGYASTYKVEGARAQVEQKEATLADAEQQIAMEVVKAHADANAALHNLTASATLLAAAQEALAVVQRKYAKGAADIVELLNVQSALADARHERIRCLAEWRSARLRLLASAGQLGRTLVGQ
jgi:outer membrane protein